RTMTGYTTGTANELTKDGTWTYSYDNEGNLTKKTKGGDRFKWTSREFDGETGLQYNRERYYAATIGRWTVSDPLGLDAGDSNLYRYVFNCSIGYADPSGLLPKLAVGPELVATSVLLQAPIPGFVAQATFVWLVCLMEF